MRDKIEQVVNDIIGAQTVSALTGAGISVESGIPPFRGKGGLWEKIDPMEYAHIDAFNRNPKKVWEVLIKDMKDVLDRAHPNDAHKALYRLETLGKLKTIITQNVDGLHQLAGNSDVIEFHGNFAFQRCTDCDDRRPTNRILMDVIPPQCHCGGIYRPDCIFFGEMIPPNALLRSQTAAADCDVMLVVGTSATVHPAAFMPALAKERGAKVIEINPEPTPLTGSISDYLIQGKSGHIMNQIVQRLDDLPPNIS